MITNGSYELETFSTSTKSEIKRLDAQIDLFWSEEVSVYKNAGIKDNSHIVDLGCGTGYLLEKLAREFPTAKFTGVEQDHKLFDISCQRLQNVPSVSEINHASIEQFCETDNDYDFVIMRLVLEHIPNPLNTLNQIRSVLKPGGRIIVIDNDFDYHLNTYPPIPELDLLYSAYKRSRMADGGDPCIGIRLPSLLNQAGFDNIRFNSICSHNFFTGDPVFLTAEGAGIPAQLTKSGFLDENIFDSLVNRWKTMLSTEDHILFRQLFVSSGTLSTFRSTHKSSSALNFPNNKPQHGSFNGDSSSFICTTIADSLQIPPADIDCEMPLIDAGIDSVEALNLQIAIKDTYNVDIKISEFLSGNSISDISALIKTRINISN